MVQALASKNPEIAVSCTSTRLIGAGEQIVKAIVVDGHQGKSHACDVCSRDEWDLGAAGASVDGVLLVHGFQMLALGEVLCAEERSVWQQCRKKTTRQWSGRGVRTHKPSTSQHSVPHALVML